MLMVSITRRLARSPAIVRRRIEAVKEHLDLVDVARELCRERGAELRKKGQRWRGKCPLCDNGEHSDAFSCDSVLFYCFACGRGGDVVRLAALVCDMPDAMAAAWLGERYGIELPARPDSWFKKQDRQARLRAGIEEKRRNVKRRRLFRLILVPMLRSSGATAEEVKAAWEDFKDLPV